MSSPVKQVGNRRLPPLPCTSATVRPDKNAHDKKINNGVLPPKAPSSGTKSDSSLNGSIDMNHAFYEGPFRDKQSFNAQMSEWNTDHPSLSKNDPNMFLHGESFVVLIRGCLRVIGKFDWLKVFHDEYNWLISKFHLSMFCQNLNILISTNKILHNVIFN